MNTDELIITRDGNKIMFYEEINPKSAMVLIEHLRCAALHSLSIGNEHDIEPPPIILRINSNGGRVPDSLAIADFIKGSNIPVHTIIDGYCASGATMISMSGHRRFINKYGVMMIHQLNGYMWGTFEQMKVDTKNNTTYMQQAIDFYAENSNLSQKRIKKILKNDINFTAKQCLEYGMVDVIVGVTNGR